MLRSTLQFVALLPGCMLPVLAAPSYAVPKQGSIEWKNCTIPLDGAECGKISVPIDYSQPTGRTTTLAMVRAKSNSTTPKGTIFLNPGGPGGSGVELLVGLLQSPTLPGMELLKDYHLIGLDPRGVGQSSPIKCSAKLWNIRVPTMVETEAEYKAMARHWKAVGHSCRMLTGPLFDHLDTTHVVRDFDFVRQAIGEEKFNLVGLSYGTQIAYTYAEMFPQNVGRLLLDGVLDHGQRGIDTVQTESAAFEITLHKFFEWCEGDETCSLHDKGDVQAFFKRLTAKALAKPLDAPNCNQTAEAPCRSSVTLEELITSVQGGLIPGQAQWGALADNLLAASKGDASALSVPYFTGETDPKGSWASLAIGCQDWGRARGFADLRAVQHATNTLSPLTLGYTQSLGYYARCVSWPVKPSNPQQALKKGITHAPPMLLANSFWDPSTSVQWAVSIHEQIPNSVLVFRNGSGHTSYNSPGEIATAMNEFLLEGKLPKEGTVYQN
ncbi:tripeptidyl aminopeptidase [Trichoderma arundinaceum]|uniref:Tripeptidyl aminopeptidase n=1 Tax=Trichoderma arundinaceum TaxID=490622 RepID=A0A395NVC9_TRIAR|nr:tripeptidyl aminopeptidase [Trichoderma arundinaceum]